MKRFYIAILSLFIALHVGAQTMGRLPGVLYPSDRGSRTSSNLSAQVTAVSTIPYTFVLDRGTWEITTDVSIPATITVVMLPGATFSIATGINLEILGRFEAGAEEVFSGLGTASGPASFPYRHAEWGDATQFDIGEGYLASVGETATLTYNLAGTADYLDAFFNGGTWTNEATGDGGAYSSDLTWGGVWEDDTWHSAALLPALRTNFAFMAHNGAIANWNMSLYSNILQQLVTELDITPTYSNWNGFVNETDWSIPVPTYEPFTFVNFRDRLSEIAVWGNTNTAYWLGTNFVGFPSFTALSNNFSMLNQDVQTINTNFAAVSNDFQTMQSVVNANAGVLVTNAVAHNYNFTNVLYNVFNSMFEGIPGWNGAEYLASIYPASTNASFLSPGSLGSYLSLTNWYATEFTNTVVPYVKDSINTGNAWVHYWGWDNTNRLDDPSHYSVTVTHASPSQYVYIPTNDAFQVHGSNGSGITVEYGFSGVPGASGIKITTPGRYMVVAAMKLFDVEPATNVATEYQPVASYSYGVYDDSNVSIGNVGETIVETMPYSMQPFQVGDRYDPGVLSGYRGRTMAWLNIGKSALGTNSAYVVVRPQVQRYSRNGGTSNMVHVIRSMSLVVSRDPEVL